MIDDDETISLLTLYRDTSTVQNWLAAKPIKKFKASDQSWTGTLSDTKIDATASPAFNLTLLSASNGNEVYFGRGNDIFDVRGSRNSIFMGAGRNTITVNGYSNIIRTGDFSNTNAVVRSVTSATGNGNRIFLSASGETVTVNGSGNQVKAEGTSHTINVLGNRPGGLSFNAYLSVSRSRVNIASGHSKTVLAGEKNNIFFNFALNSETELYSPIINGQGYFGWVNTVNYSTKVFEINLYDGNYEIVPGTDFNANSNKARINLYSTSTRYQTSTNGSVVHLNNADINSYGHNVRTIGSYNYIAAKKDGGAYSFIGTDNILAIQSNRGTVAFVHGQAASLNIDLERSSLYTNWGTVDLSTAGAQSINFRTSYKQAASYQYQSDGSVHIKVNDHVVFRATGMEFKVDSLLLNGKSIFF